MADGEVKIDTKLDTDGLNEGLKDLKVKLNNLGVETEKETKKEKELNEELDETADAAEKAGEAVEKSTKKNKNLGDILKTVKSKIKSTTIAGVAATVAIKKTVDALNDCEAAYKVQRNAEIALQQAAKNNPYLNDESVYNLRNFASELQSMTNIGDEQSLQVMAQLAAMGRTEEQIQAIMKAAADMSAVTGNSIQNIAVQLNKTYSGLAGELGEANSAIRALTQEELKSGKAIEIIAAQYKGQAAAMADNTVQLSNAWGDFKENIGRGWSKVTAPVKQFFLDVLNDINEATAKTNALKDAKGNDAAGTATAADTKILLDDAQNRLNQLKEINKNYVKDATETVKSLEELQAEWDAKYGKMNPRARREIGAPDRPRSVSELAASGSRKGGAYIQAAAAENQKEIERLEKEVERLTNQYTELKDAEDKAAEAAQAAAIAAKKKADAQKREKDAEKYIKANTKALQEQIKAMELKASFTGEEIDAGEMYNAYMQSYIDLITKSNGLVKENNQAAKERLATLQEWAQKAKDAATEEERLAAAKKAQEEATALLKDIDDGKHKTIFDEYDEKNKQLEEWREKVDQYEKDRVISEQEAADARLEIERQYWQNKKDLAETMTAEINGYIQQTADIAKEAGDLMLENLQSQTNTELMELEKKYEAGEMSEEEYYEKQKQIQQKAAREEYKIKMFQWTASMLAATANIAEGVSKAIAQGGVAGIVTGALVAAAGGVQLASIIASKPTPPNFYKGGVIGGANGATMGGDNTYIHARAGEMILNAHQQRNLWDMINGQGGRGETSLDLTVNNTQSNKVDTQFREEDGAIILDIVDKRVNKGFIDGTFDGGYATMLSRQEGERIL